MLYPSNQLGVPPLDSLQQVHVHPVLGPQSWIQCYRWGLIRAEQRGRIPSLTLLPTMLWMQPRTGLAFWAASVHCWIMSILSPTSTHQVLGRAALDLCIPSLLVLGPAMTQAQHQVLLNLTDPCHKLVQVSLWMDPVLQVCQQHRSAWCHLQICWECTQSLHLHHQ